MYFIGNVSCIYICIYKILILNILKFLKLIFYSYVYENSYSITVHLQCTKPWVLAKCDRCGAQIGGTDHKLAAGSTRIDLEQYEIYVIICMQRGRVSNLSRNTVHKVNPQYFLFIINPL